MDAISSLLNKRILFFGGKGGVGKTTMAAAFALRSASLGKKTLLVSTDPAHSTSDILQTELGPDPRPIRVDFWAMEIDPEEETDRYIAGVKQRMSDYIAPRLVDEVERQIDIARVSPGAEEAAVFDRFARLLESESRQFERILFDTAPTGQTLRLLSLPELMSVWISGLISRRRKVNVLGRMWRNVAGAAAGDVAEGGSDAVIAMLEERKARFHRVRQLVTDAKHTAFTFVLTPERLPILETERAVRTLKKHGIPVGAILVNRVLPNDADGEFLAKRREQEAEYLRQIDRSLGDYPIYHVPLQEMDVVGTESLLRLATVAHTAYDAGECTVS